jgi:rod shape-determining protein MreC
VFFKRLRNVLIVWLVLLALLALFSSFAPTNRDFSLVESTLVDGILPVFSVFTSLKTGVTSWWNHYIYLINTQQENDQLKKKLGQMQQENNRLKETALAHERLLKLLNLKDVPPIPIQVGAIVGRNPGPFIQLLFINKGRKDGLVRGMPVILPQGVVGRLEKISGRYSEVLLLNNPGFAVDCLAQRTRVQGILTGVPGQSHCQMKYVAATSDIKPGDVIITSGLDNLFPKGLILGRVLRVVPQAKGSFPFIEVIPEVPFSQIEEVQVITRKPPIPDQENLKDGG